MSLRISLCETCSSPFTVFMVLKWAPVSPCLSRGVEPGTDPISPEDHSSDEELPSSNCGTGCSTGMSPNRHRDFAVSMSSEQTPLVMPENGKYFKVPQLRHAVPHLPKVLPSSKERTSVLNLG